MKIVLGTANFNIPYGLNRNRIKKKEISKILIFSKKKKILYIDNAELYYKKKDVLFKKVKNFKFNTKISNIKGFSQEVINNNLNKKILQIQKLYKIKNINTLFLHSPKEILHKKNGKYLINALKKAKKNRLINKIGYSVYNEVEAKKFVKIFKPDVIQIPFNIIDRRLIKTNLANTLKKKKIKIEVRSIFLQGLLTDRSFVFNKLFKKDKKILLNWYRWLDKQNLSPEEGAIKFILKYKKNIDSVVIGVDNFKQLKKNISFFKSKKNIIFPEFNLTRKTILDPRKW